MKPARVEKSKMEPLGAELAPQLAKGERLKLFFVASDGLWRRAYQASIIEWRLEAHPEEFFVKSVDYQKKGKLIFEVEIKTSAEKLLTEKEIVNLILSYNPKGFALVFINATSEFVEEKVIPGVKAASSATLQIAVVLLIVYLVFKSG